jgi:hypothetical protein
MRRVVLLAITAIAVGAVGATTTEAAKPTCKAKHEKKGCAIKGHWSYSAVVRQHLPSGGAGTSRYTVSMKSKKSFQIVASGFLCDDGNFFYGSASAEVAKQAKIGKTYTGSRSTAGADMTATVTFTSAKKAKLSIKYTIRSITAEETKTCSGSTTQTLARG